MYIFFDELFKCLSILGIILKIKFISINLTIICIFNCIQAHQESGHNFHSSGFEAQERHEIVFPRISPNDDRFRRDLEENDLFGNENSVLFSQQMVTIRAEIINKTFYVLIFPNNNDFISTNTSFEGTTELNAQNHTNCLYTGVIISPVKGRAAITRCDNSDKMYALLITETEGTFVLRPLDYPSNTKIEPNVETKHKKLVLNPKQTKQTLRNKQYLGMDDNSSQGLTTMINDITGQTDEDNNQFMAHVLVRVNQSETEFCDLAFIDENDRKRAFNEFISMSDNMSNNLFRRRKRRAMKTQKTIETAVYIDKQLLKRFNGLRTDLTRLVLAIMNEVQLIYSFKTMKTRIKIVIVKMVFLSDSDNGPNNADGDIDEYLDNFCSWQSKKWSHEKQSNRWDHALMLTGLDLYKQMGDKKNKKVLGLAWVNGMCKPTYSCTLNEGKSFEAAFVIAHEMGHSLGILHDGTGNNCDGDKYIMSEKTGPGKINWSPCSNIYLENFLTKANVKCLDEESIPANSDLNFERSNRLPGEQYPPNKQCQLALGSTYKAYTSSKEPFNDICRELWCLSGSWATPAHPALEGSTCDDGKQCVQGVCKSSSSYVRRRSVKTLSQTSNRVSELDSNKNMANSLSSKRSKGLSRVVMDGIKGFLRSATSGAQDFFKLFTG